MDKDEGSSSPAIRLEDAQAYSASRAGLKKGIAMAKGSYELRINYNL